jgi:molybdate transport system ATP-binding protein
MLPLIALDRANLHLAGRHVLKNVSWSLHPGDHWAVIGANGSGKSTLLRVIAGTQWIDYDGGARRYSADGSQLDAVARATTWIRHVSAEQHEHYARLELPLTGRELIATGLADSVYLHRPPTTAQAERVEALVAVLDLGRFVGRPMRELSSGQFRRLLIARAMVSEPRILILDEFTNGLDRMARREVLTFVDRIAASVALIVASHRLDDFPTAVTRTANVREGSVSSAPGRPPQSQPRRAQERAGQVRLSDEILVRIRHADVYRGTTRVLEDVNWELRRGEHTAIRGANGAGKTTFAGLVAGTIAAASGADIVRFGKTGPFNVWTLKERIAHVSDDLQVAYDRGETVEAVIASGFPASIGLFTQPSAAQRGAVAELLERIGLAALSGRIFTQLSFGERRKVLIARSLVRRPDIFILDEIWNGLDAEFRGRLRTVLDELMGSGTTLVAIAHEDDDEIVALTPRICSIANGRIHESEAASRAENRIRKTV